MKIVKQKNSFAILSDDGSFLARFNDIVSAAAVMRYLSGVEMTDYEKIIAISALSGDENKVIKDMDLPIHIFNALYVNSSKMLFIPKENCKEIRDEMRAVIEADEPPANCVITLIMDDNQLYHCCVE